MTKGSLKARGYRPFPPAFAMDCSHAVMLTPVVNEHVEDCAPFGRPLGVPIRPRP